MEHYKVTLHSIDGYIKTHSIYTMNEQDAIKAAKTIACERFPRLQFDSIKIKKMDILKEV